MYNKPHHIACFAEIVVHIKKHDWWSYNVDGIQHCLNAVLICFSFTYINSLQACKLVLSIAHLSGKFEVLTGKC